MFIQTESTPNPATIKFIPDTSFMTAGLNPVDFRVGDDVTCAPLAASLFNVDGVAGVMIAPDYVAVTKDDTRPWEAVKTGILMAIMDHLAAAKPDVLSVPLKGGGQGRGDGHQDHPLRHASGCATSPLQGEDNPVIAQIIDLLETRVRPAVAQDGGDITFSHFEDGVVYVHLRGACAGCPSSTATLKSGIENMMKHYIPDVRAVEAA